MSETPSKHFEYTINEWSSGEYRILFDTVPSVSVFYDLGANGGGFSKIILDKNPECKVYAFEPVWSNFKTLKENLPQARCLNVGIYYGKHESKALWRGSNCGAYFVEYVNAGKDVIDSGEVMILVELEGLKLPKPDLIKLDVEGAEDNILEYSQIVKECPYLIIEWHLDDIDTKNFFAKHLPKHKVIYKASFNQYLLKYEAKNKRINS